MFEGFSPATIDFMRSIRLNNNKPWFEAHKDDYKHHFHAPMKALGQDVFARINAAYGGRGFVHKLSRIYRDARRVRDGNPYRDHLWFSIEKPTGAGDSNDVLTFWFSLGPDEWSYGLGYYAAKAATMENFRARVNTNPNALETLVNRLHNQNEFALEGPEYARPKTAPTPKTQAWYNKKSFSLIHYGQIDDALFAPAFADRLVEGYAALMPFYDYFAGIENHG